MAMVIDKGLRRVGRNQSDRQCRFNGGKGGPVIRKIGVFKTTGNETSCAKMTTIFWGATGYDFSANALKEPEVRRVHARCAFANGKHITKSPLKFPNHLTISYPYY
jgi:hypothetical protein